MKVANARMAILIFLSQNNGLVSEGNIIFLWDEQNNRHAMTNKWERAYNSKFDASPFVTGVA
jgi:hypothetical protein